jgi:hypothetical protein
MTKQQKNQPDAGQQKQDALAGMNTRQDIIAKQQTDTTDERAMPRTSDAGGGISEGSLYDASGAATGGGVDTPTDVEQRTEDEVRKQKPIDQGNSAYTGGGADNGSDL